MTRDRWLELEVRHFAALDAVSLEGSFRGAADRLGYVQSAISQQVAFLERAAGVRLVERSRGPGRIALTPAGHLVLARVRDILGQLESAQADLSALEALERRTVRLGLAPAPLTDVLAALVGALSDAAPGVILDPHDFDTDDELAQELLSGRLDLALAELPAPAGSLSEPLVTEPYRILATPRPGLPRTVPDIARHPIIAPLRAPSFDCVEAWFGARGVTLSIAYRSSDPATIAGWARAGLGLAIVSSRYPEREWPGLDTLLASESLPTRTVSLLRRPDLPDGGAAASVRDAARTIAGGPISSR